jgi:hypothetical protein
MWEFDRAAGDPTFLVVMRGEDAFAVPGRWRDRLVLHGSLRGYQDDEPAGTALIVQTRSREEIDELTAAGSGEVEVLDWAFGGRR